MYTTPNHNEAVVRCRHFLVGCYCMLCINFQFSVQNYMCCACCKAGKQQSICMRSMVTISQSTTTILGDQTWPAKHAHEYIPRFFAIADGISYKMWLPSQPQAFKVWTVAWYCCPEKKLDSYTGFVKRKFGVSCTGIVIQTLAFPDSAMWTQESAAVLIELCCTCTVNTTPGSHKTLLGQNSVHIIPDVLIQIDQVHNQALEEVLSYNVIFLWRAQHPKHLIIFSRSMQAARLCWKQLGEMLSLILF